MAGIGPCEAPFLTLLAWHLLCHPHRRGAFQIQTCALQAAVCSFLFVWGSVSIKVRARPQPASNGRPNRDTCNTRWEKTARARAQGQSAKPAPRSFPSSALPAAPRMLSRTVCKWGSESPSCVLPGGSEFHPGQPGALQGIPEGSRGGQEPILVSGCTAGISPAPRAPGHPNHLNTRLCLPRESAWTAQ